MATTRLIANPAAAAIPITRENSTSAQAPMAPAMRSGNTPISLPLTYWPTTKPAIAPIATTNRYDILLSWSGAHAVGRHDRLPLAHLVGWNHELEGLAEAAQAHHLAVVDGLSGGELVLVLDFVNRGTVEASLEVGTLIDEHRIGE